jgi:hypothetical protein
MTQNSFSRPLPQVAKAEASPASGEPVAGKPWQRPRVRPLDLLDNTNSFPAPGPDGGSFGLTHS